MSAEPVPFFSPRLFDEDRATALRLIHEVGTAPEQRFILGEHTRALEDALSRDLDGAHVVACGSGTGALTMALAALGVGPGDEVVVPALGCAPLASAPLALGATPVFADVDPVTLTLDPGDAERQITARTRALVPAHLFSTMADMPRLRALAAARGLRLMEDSAVAQGAVLAGTPAGLWGEAGVYSFVQVKTFGMPGEGGVVVTRDAELATRVRLLRNHGQREGERFTHRLVGHNSRFDEIQARLQLHRLPGLPARLARRAHLVDAYTRLLAPLAGRGVIAPPPGRDGRCGYVYTVLADDREGLAGQLRAEGVETHVYYPRALPHHAAFRPFAPPGRRWPVAESAAARMLSLPLYPELTDAQVARVADAVWRFVERRTPEHIREFGDDTDRSPAASRTEANPR
ncbi:DegT/DnrJ/EryC1/StrS family aminotransferase [Streptomyces sp. 3MP-14]|uniref:DegT/DnrJ/EryC1/StrS family aminotransferase n=1 Tax=Streptomyces mimosae TaxID=2586635 RepID=A0A5N5ZZR9_9ACTN|nr:MULTISPECIES: DegT/DnrJ/EryC1/StrS family aminotransferase [Streptomyces]KAB8161269.1 DegT/DnrJ/EryC1/StrS family aminotransferase [Streptomyces mimosae]KAB8173071.1 DegT/DnrJ/EryC1/StrS family aminotransferase [Streptomyces sp. 3MP-14]